ASFPGVGSTIAAPRVPPRDGPGSSAARAIRGRRAAPYDRVVTKLAARVTGLPQQLVTRVAALPPRRQEWVQDAGLAVALAAVNVVSLLPYRAQLHPFWLALVLVAAQGIPLAWRRSGPVGTMVVI